MNLTPELFAFTWDAVKILAVTAMALAILGIARPQWPLVAVASFLLGVALLIK